MSNPSNTDRATRTWQRKLLPFMILMIAGLTLFFVVASFNQLNRLNSQILETPKLNLEPALNTKSRDDEMMEQHWKALVILEGNALERRYHQANVLLLSRVWIRYMGFLTGMIIGLIGATFILGKLTESESKIDGDAATVKFSITTASPGLVLVLLGTILMVTAMITNPAIEVKDTRSYMGDKDTPIPGVGS